MLVVAFGLAVCSGCSSLAPYQRPSAGATLEQRQSVYQAHRVTFDAWAGPSLNHQAHFPPISYYQFSNYFEASGDMESGKRLRQASPYRWASWAAGLAGAALFIYMPRNNDGGRSAASYAALATGFVIGLSGKLWTDIKFFLPAASNFNRHLRQDLSLPEKTIQGDF